MQETQTQLNILLIGASGMIGSRIADEAVRRGHHVLAAARTTQKLEASDLLTPLALDVNNVNDVAAHAEQADVVISAVSPRSSGRPTEDALAFTRSLVEVSRNTGTRILMVGGGGTLQHPDGRPVTSTVPETYRAEAEAMRRAYGALVAEDIDFAVLAPSGMIAPGERTGTFRLGGRVVLSDADGNSQISAEDYAIAMLDEAEQPRHFRTVFTVAY